MHTINILVLLMLLYIKTDIYKVHDFVFYCTAGFICEVLLFAKFARAGWYIGNTVD